MEPVSAVKTFQMAQPEEANMRSFTHSAITLSVVVALAFALAFMTYETSNHLANSEAVSVIAAAQASH